MTLGREIKFSILLLSIVGVVSRPLYSFKDSSFIYPVAKTLVEVSLLESLL